MRGKFGAQGVSLIHTGTRSSVLRTGMFDPFLPVTESALGPRNRLTWPVVVLYTLLAHVCKIVLTCEADRVERECVGKNRTIFDLKIA